MEAYDKFNKLPPEVRHMITMKIIHELKKACETTAVFDDHRYAKLLTLIAAAILSIEAEEDITINDSRRLIDDMFYIAKNSKLHTSIKAHNKIHEQIDQQKKNN